MSYEPAAFVANEDWKRARRQVIYQKIVCAVTQCSVKMPSFEVVRQTLRLEDMQYQGLREIPVVQIKGSVGRFDDFTSTFLPRKEHMQQRWQQVDQLMIEGQAPPIEVYQVDQIYFVVDGNHRVSAARQNGLRTIRAHVTTFPSPFEVDPAIDIDQVLMKVEQERFLHQVGQAEARSAGEIVFTCPGSYRDLQGQIDAYRRGMEVEQERPVSFAEAYAVWHEDVYSAAVAAIRQDRLLALFPDRTEADLFIWAWQNSDVLEATT